MALLTKKTNIKEVPNIIRLYVAAGITYIPPPKIDVAIKIARVPFWSPHSIVIHFLCSSPDARNLAR